MLQEGCSCFEMCFSFQVKFSFRTEGKSFLGNLYSLVLRKNSDIFLIEEHSSQIKKKFRNKLLVFAVYVIQLVRHTAE